MKKIVNLLGHGLFYTAAVSIESIAPFILAPFLTHYLSVYDYGIWAIFQGACAFLRPLLGLSLDDYVRMRYHHHTRERMMGYLIAIIGLSGFISFIICLLATLTAQPLSALLHFPEHWLWSIIVCSGLQAIFYMLLAYYQFESRKTRFALIHLLQALTTLGLSVMLVMHNWGWSGAIIGKIIGLSFGTALAWHWIARNVPESPMKYFTRAQMRELCSFAWRYLPNGMVFAVIILTDRLMLANLMSVQQVSLFAVASLFPMALLITIQGYIFGWQPWCFKRLARRERSDIPELALGAAFFFVGLPIGGLILTWGANWLGPYVIDTQFHEAFRYIFPLSMAMVAQGFYYFAQSILQYYQRLLALSWIAIITMLSNLILNYGLIATMGTLGSAWATMIAYMIGFGLTALLAIITIRKEYILSFK